MKRLILLLWVLTLPGVVLPAKQSPEEIDRMFGGYLTERNEWERTYGGYRAYQLDFPQPSENQVNMIKRMGEYERSYWDACKKGGADLEVANYNSLRFYFAETSSNVNRYQVECSIRYIPSLSQFRGQQRRGIAVAIMGGEVV
jgi:hypothetical protein